MTKTKEENEYYSLEESRDKIGVLPIPIIKDQTGRTIDGNQREKHGLPCPIVTVKVNPLQFEIAALITNACRREMPSEEVSERLGKIAKLSQWTPKEMAKRLPFKYTWIMKYLPDEFKERPHDFEVIHENVDNSRRELCHENVKFDGEISGTSSESPVDQPQETMVQFAERFTNTFEAHLVQLTRKDLPTIITYMDENGHCDECTVKAACAALLKWTLAVQTQLPVCMRAKLTH